MFIAALVITARTWKQPRCPSVGEWVNKLWYIQTTERYSSRARNELPNHEKTRRNLKFILFSERSQSEKAAYCIIPTTWHSGKGKTMETVKMSLVEDVDDWGGYAYMGVGGIWEIFIPSLSSSFPPGSLYRVAWVSSQHGGWLPPASRDRTIQGSKTEAEMPWEPHTFTSALFSWSHRSAMIQCGRGATQGYEY